MSNAKMQENNIIAKFGNQYGFTSETNTVKMVSELCFRYFAPTKRSLYLLVSKSIELGLDPFRGEIYPTLHTDENTGQMVPGVDIGYEGWMKVAKRDASYRGVTFNYSDETIEVPAPAGVPLSAHAWVEATIHLHEAEDVVVREYFDECYSPTSEAWNNKPKRYHRMVAYSQAVRLAINTDEQGERLFLNEDLDFEFESDNQRPPEAATVQPVVTQGEPNIKAVDSQPAKAQAEADAQVQAQAEAEADAKAQAEADAQVQAQAEAEADAKAQAEADAKAQAEAEAEAEAKAKAEAEAEAEAKAKAEAEAEAEAEAKAKAEAEAEAEAEAKAKAEAEAEAEAEAKAKAEAEAEAKAAAASNDVTTELGECTVTPSAQTEQLFNFMAMQFRNGQSDLAPMRNFMEAATDSNDIEWMKHQIKLLEMEEAA